MLYRSHFWGLDAFALVTTLPEDGFYVVFANAFEGGESGDYYLRATLK